MPKSNGNFMVDAEDGLRKVKCTFCDGSGEVHNLYAGIDGEPEYKECTECEGNGYYWD